MADDIKAIVQRMIDAGESEENIATVIQHFTSTYQPDPTMQARTAQAMSERAGALPLGHQMRSDAPDASPSFLTRIGQAMEPIAHPTTFSDIAPLLIPGTAGAGEISAPSLIRGTLRAVKAGGQAAADGSYTGAPIRFMRSAIAEVKRPLSVERYAPNLAGDSGPFVADAERLNAPMEPPLPQGPSQAVYVKLPDGRFALKAAPGHTLTEGASVHAMNRAGTGTMHTVGPLTPEGFAPLASHEAQNLGMTGGSGYSIPDDVQARVMQLLRRQGRQ